MFFSWPMGKAIANGHPAHVFHGTTCMQCLQLALDIIESELNIPHRNDQLACRDILPDPPGLLVGPYSNGHKDASSYNIHCMSQV